MNILGIYGALGWNGNSSLDEHNRYSWVHDSGATLIKDGVHCCSISEERLTRNKYEGNFPSNSIQYCLNAGKINAEEITHVVAVVTPSPVFYDMLDFGIIHNNIIGMFPDAEVSIISHHTAHAYASVATSPFDSGSILSLDGAGSILRNYYGSSVDVENSSLGAFDRRNNSLQIFPSCGKVNNFGDLYSIKSLEIYNEKTGKQISWENDKEKTGIEGKVMGLSAYGDHHMTLNYIISSDEYSGPPLVVFDNFGNTDGTPEDKASALQATLEEALSDWIVELRNTGYLQERVCFSGGIFMNVLANTVIKKLDCIKEIHIPPFTSDVGLHFGAACSVLYKKGIKVILPTNISLLGREYTEEEIETDLRNFGLL